MADAIPSWLQYFQKAQNTPGYGASGFNATAGNYTDPTSGRVYGQTYQSDSSGGESGYTGGSTLTGYSSSDGKPWYQGQVADQYDLQGAKTGQFLTANPTNFGKDDLAGVLAVLSVALGGVGLAGAMGGAGAGAGAAAAGGEAASLGGMSSAAGPGMAGWGMDLGAESLANLGYGAEAAGAGAGGGLDFATGFTDGGTAGGALDTAYAGTGSSVGPGFTEGFTDGGTAGGALDTNYAAGTMGTNGGISPGGASSGSTSPGTGFTPKQLVSTAGTVASAMGGGSGSSSTGGGSDTGGVDLSSILQGLGGVWDYNNQNNASNDMLAYLKERQGINDNMYKPGSDEYNALWDEMSRKDAAAGRNSQYGPRSVDLAARIAQLKMDANTRMTTGIGGLYKDAINQGAGSNAGIMSALGAMAGGGGTGMNLGSLFNLLSRNGGSFSGDGTNAYDGSTGFGTGSNYDNEDLGQYL